MMNLQRDNEDESIIPTLEENAAGEIWSEVRKIKEERDSFSEREAPLSLIGSSHKATYFEELASRVQDLECADDGSETNTLATLPSFQGDYEARMDIIPIPSSQQLIPLIKDTANLQAILYFDPSYGYITFS